MRKTSLLLLSALLLSTVNIGHPQSVEAMSSTTLGDQIITSADKYVGTPYRYGSSENTTATFDCSSFTKRVFGNIGITLPRVSADQFNIGTPVSRNELQKGDLVFYATITPGRVGHVGIYAGNGKMIGATTSRGVTYSDAFSSYWAPLYLGARRISAPVQHFAQPAPTSRSAYYKKPATAAPVNVYKHVVKSGESLWIIANRHKTSVQHIININHLKSTNIYPGQVIKLY